MLFNSPEYLVFFLVVLALSWITIGFPRLRLWILLLASYYFYTSNNSWLISLILISTQIDYLSGIRIEGTANKKIKKRWLQFSLITNLGILGFFKYFNFFASSVANFTQTLGYEMSWVDINIILPVGISFYTFQSMSYTIDVYNGKIPAEKSWLRFSFYVAFFPQLIAGPIVRAGEFIPQIPRQPLYNAVAFEKSIFLIVRGLTKKIILADFLAAYVDIAFDNPAGASWFAVWLGVYAFAFQIYFDFSGYTDIAIGSARLLGYRLPINFIRPYQAWSISDFWRRWHISLSSWLRDYLYIPLGGSRTKTSFGVYRNLMITMVLGGLWHGAAWNFIIWGALHGGLLSLERAVGISARSRKMVSATLFRRFMIFNLICMTWIPFRIESMPKLMELMAKMTDFTTEAVITNGALLAIAIIVSGWFAQYFGERAHTGRFIVGLPIIIRGGIYASLCVGVLIFNASGTTPFIYFRF